VDLLAAYSNRPELLRPLADVLRQAERAEADQEAAYKEQSEPAGTPSRRHRLAPNEIESLVQLFLDGMTQSALADKYGLSLSGVKWVLRRHRVQRG
jgi:DNA invertase Pin-like site-specific DNA recombinase